MKLRRTLSCIFAAGALSLASASASAITVTTADAGSTFQIDWTLLAGQLDNDGGATSPFDLTATGTFLISSFTGSAITLNVTIANTTTPPNGENAGITSFGIGVRPDATSVQFSDTNDGAFSSALVQTGQQNYPGGYKDIDVCVFTQGCSGGSQGSALAAGASDSFVLQIAGNFGGKVELDPFAIKFQTDAGSFEFSGDTPPTTVPEPASLALMGLGLVGLGFARRRARN
jgi:hypothetical protein